MIIPWTFLSGNKHTVTQISCGELLQGLSLCFPVLKKKKKSPNISSVKEQKFSLIKTNMGYLMRMDFHFGKYTYLLSCILFNERIHNIHVSIKHEA